MLTLKNYINGKWVEADCSEYLDVTNPSTGEVFAKVPLSTAKNVEEAVNAASKAFEKWSRESVSKRTSYLFKLHSIMDEHEDELVEAICKEGGKTLVDGKAEIKRAVQNIEVACGMPMLLQGEKLQGIANEMDAEVIRQPIGVFAIIPPFNFPAMVPFWFLPYAIATGNTLVIKPSEQVPVTMQLIMGLIDKIGLPQGVINIVNGDKTVAEALTENKAIRGVSFVGSSKVARIIAETCSKNGKRYQALGSAKNHLLVMEDACIDKVIDSLMTSCYGCAGERCMAASVVAVVPEVYDEVREKFIAAAKKLKTGDALGDGVDVGPVISQRAKERILGLIQKGIDEGASLILDGRNPDIPKEIQKGFYIGPTIFENVTPDMTIMQEEIFGPVVCLVKINSLDDGLELVKNCRFGNGASIFTQSGYYARKFEMEVDAGMIGINVGIPAPVAYFPFGGVKESFYGDVKAQGRDVINFFTERKVVTARFYKQDK